MIEMVDIQGNLYLKIQSLGWRREVGGYAMRVAKDGMAYWAVKSTRKNAKWMIWQGECPLDAGKEVLEFYDRPENRDLVSQPSLASGLAKQRAFIAEWPDSSAHRHAPMPIPEPGTSSDAGQ